MSEAVETTRSRSRRFQRVAAAIGLASLSTLAASGTTRAQAPGAATASQTHLTIPYLASAKPGDIEFAAAECDLTQSGEQMTCRFRQVFVTVASIDATACVISSSGYDQTFGRANPTRWVSTSQPAGDCGLVETTTLEDGGGTRWTMTIETKATRRGDRAQCSAAADASAMYSWSNIKRKLPCATIQPGFIER